MAGVPDSYSQYKLTSDALLRFLKTVFPEWTEFNIKVCCATQLHIHKLTCTSRRMSPGLSTCHKYSMRHVASSESHTISLTELNYRNNATHLRKTTVTRKLRYAGSMRSAAAASHTQGGAAMDDGVTAFSLAHDLAVEEADGIALGSER